MNGLDRRDGSWHETQQVGEAVRLGSKDDDSNVSTTQILLVLDALVHSEEDFKSGSFCRRKQVTVFQSSHSSIAGGLAIVTGEGVPESLIDAFIDQDSHLWTCEQEVFRFFESSNGRFTGHGGKSFQKILNRLSAFQVVKESLDRHAGSTKHWSSAKNVRVFDDNVHAEIVARHDLDRPVYDSSGSQLVGAVGIETKIHFGS